MELQSFAHVNTDNNVSVGDSNVRYIR